jgi:hypothetical protein
MTGAYSQAHGTASSSQLDTTCALFTS